MKKIVERYSDKSEMSVFGKSKLLSKIDRYDWNLDTRSPGVQMMLSKKDMVIDTGYQREAVSDAVVGSIAKDWDWRFFGSLSVAEWIDPEEPEKPIYAIIDGGHRWRASLLRSDVEMLPCVVFKNTTEKDEAEAFVGINSHRKAVKAIEKYRAGILYGDEACLMAKSILDELGLHASHNTERNGFQAVSSLVVYVKKDFEKAREAMRICRSCMLDDFEMITRDVFTGILTLVARGQEVGKPPWIGKLRLAGTRVLQDQINRKRHLVGQGGEKVAAIAISEFLNKNMRTNKLSTKW